MTEPRHLHFTREEFAGRLTKLRTEMAARRLDAMLVFAPESQYWLTGFDTFGFCFFQCLIVRAEGDYALLTRSADLRQAQITSLIEHVRVWKDAVDARPSRDLRGLLEELGLKGARLGIEMDTHGLTAANYQRVAADLADWAELHEASDVIPALRLVKSPSEIAYVRRAAEIGDAAYWAARPLIKAGAEETAILAAFQGEVFAQGGDYPGNPFILGSGQGALLCRYFTGRRRLEARDQLTLEWAGVYRQYHAACMRTVVLGAPTPAHERMHAAARAALEACEAAMRPGARMAEVYDAHAQTLDAHGLAHARLNACGYALGARYAPSWMEPQMFYEGAQTVIGENMVFFLHMILMDSETEAAMTLGRTSLIAAGGAEPLSKLSLELDAA